MSSIVLVASPSQVGFFTLDRPDKDTVTVVVFPKDWWFPLEDSDESVLKGLGRPQVVWDGSSSTLYIRQGAWIAVSPEGLLLTGPLLEVVTALKGAVEGARRSAKSPTTDVALGSPGRALVFLDKRKLKAPDVVPGKPKDPALILASLLELYAYARRRGEPDPGGLRVGVSHNPDLQWAVADRFVSLLAQQIGRLRRGYVPRRQVLGRIRGQVLPASAARAAAAGIPEVECRFQEFDHAVPLARVLSGALDVAMLRLRGGDGRAQASNQRRPAGPLRRARQCRALLSFAQETTLDDARSLVRSLTLRPEEQAVWSEIVELARCLLFSQGLGGRRGQRAPFQLRVNVAAAYEQWVAEALKTKLGEGAVKEQRVLGRPWGIPYTRSREADIWVSLAGDGAGPRWDIVIDCKHKVLDPRRDQKEGDGEEDHREGDEDDDPVDSGGESKRHRYPPVADVYQISGYLFLKEEGRAAEEKEARVDEGVRRCAALVYLPPPKPRDEMRLANANWAAELVGRDPWIEHLSKKEQGPSSSPPPGIWRWQGLPPSDRNALLIVRVPTPGPHQLFPFEGERGAPLGEALGKRLLDLIKAAEGAGSEAPAASSPPPR